MWIVIFMVALFLGVLGNALGYAVDHATTAKERVAAEKWLHVFIIICVTLLAIGGLFVLGWIWYYFCGGFFLFVEEDSFFWKAVWGLVTLLPLGFIIGLIAICLGWDPDDR